MPAIRDSESGLSKFANIVLVLIIVSGAFFGIQAIGHLYNHEELKGLIEFQVKTADARTDKAIKTLITREMDTLKINADREDLEIESSVGDISISLYYEEDIELYINEDYNWVLYTFEFDIFEEGDTSPTRVRDKV